MRTTSWRCLVVALLASAWASTASAATEAEKLAAIQAGLSQLAATQAGGGWWNYGGYEEAATGAVVFAFLSQKDKWDPSAAAQYQAAVDQGMSYLLGRAIRTTVGVRADGRNPCGAGTCTGVYWNGAGEGTYTTGLVAPAIALRGASTPDEVATSAGPLSGMTWREIAQGITNMFAAGQTTAQHGSARGGWRYFPLSADSDMSTTQWAIISLIYDQTLGVTTPQFVKDELKYWLAVVQASNGSGCYVPYSLCDHSDTGGLILGLGFVGETIASPAVQAAVGFLDANWTAPPASTWYGHIGHPYAMWAVYKGLETTIGLNDATHITHLLTSCGAPDQLPGIPPGSTPCNWWQDYSEWLVRAQRADGGWNGYEVWYGPLATAWNVTMLGATRIPTGHTLTVATGGTGFGTVSGAGIDCTTGSTAGCQSTEAAGSAVTLSAQAAEDSAFTGWEGACTGTAPTCVVTMDQDRSVTANFKLLVRIDGPYTVAEGGWVSVKATSTLPGMLDFAWDLDGDGEFDDYAGLAAPFFAKYIDGPATVGIAVRVTNDRGASAIGRSTVEVRNVAPTADLKVSRTSLDEGMSFTVSLVNATDEAPADRPTLLFAFDCGDGNGFGLPGVAKSITCTAWDNGRPTVGGLVMDDDGGMSVYTKVVQVFNVPPVVKITSPANNTVFAVGAPVGLAVEFTDKGRLDTHGCAIDWGDATTSQGTIDEANGNGTCTGSHAYAKAAWYPIKVKVTDKDGGAAAATVGVKVK
jgi:uncharacterized repeat protein (TIGR02543 family)